MRRLNNGVGTFVISGPSSDMEKLPEACHRSLRTRAMASANVGSDLAYHAAGRGMAGPSFCDRWLAKDIQEKSPKSTGVVRAMARSDHWRCVLHSQVSAYLLEGHFQLPAQHEPLHDLDRGGRKVGGQQRLRTEFPQGVSNQDPSNGHWRLARMVPEGGLRSEFHSPDSTIIPSRNASAQQVSGKSRSSFSVGSRLPLTLGRPF